MRKLIASLMICGAFVTGYAQEAEKEAEVAVDVSVDVEASVDVEVSAEVAVNEPEAAAE